MAVPVIQSFTTATDTAVSSLTLTKPASVATGELLIIMVGNDDNSAIAQWDDSTLKPTGFTLIKEAGDALADCHCAAFWRIADGTEGATIAVPAESADDYYGWYARLTGAHGTTPIDVVGADTIDASADTDKDVDGVTTTQADCLAFFLLSFDGGDGPAFTLTGTGWSISDELQAGTAPANASGCFGTKSMPSAGATGTVTIHPQVVDVSAGFQFAIAPGEAAAAAGHDYLGGARRRVAQGAVAFQGYVRR